MPLLEDSTKEDLSEKFEAMDHPRSQLPSTFFHMPNKPPVISSSLSLLTELSNVGITTWLGTSYNNAKPI
jgi:hypothetical protein